MNIKTELLRNSLAEFVKSEMEDFEIDASQIADTTATQMLSEIQTVIKNESYSDFDVVEKIVCAYCIICTQFPKNKTLNVWQ